MMTYPEVIKYLDSFIDYEKLPRYPYKQSLKLERIREFLKILNNPQDELKCIHIAGTKGKGSTCAFIAYILRQARFRVGLYTSPHLSDFRERIRILDVTRHMSHVTRQEFEGMISEDELTELVERLKPTIEDYNKNSKYGALSFFEVYTALAFIYFKEKKVDFAVLETGLGGRLDATNVVDPLIAAITPISYEHIRQLGKTLTEIASEKAGIIKGHQVTKSSFASLRTLRRRTLSNVEVPGHKLIVITAPQEEEAMNVIRDRCRTQGATLYEIGKDIIFERAEFSRNYQGFSINGEFGRSTDLKIRFLGRHQIINATLAVAAILALRRVYQAGMSLDAIREGLYNTIWPGRFEIVLRKPLVVLDGAQNLASAQALGETIIENFPDRRIILVLGISQDKDIKGICRVLLPISNEVILTKADNPRAADVDGIEQTIRNQKPSFDYTQDGSASVSEAKPEYSDRRESRAKSRENQIIKTKDVREAIELAKKKADLEDLILVTGSLFLVGEAWEFLKIGDEY